MHTRSKAKKAQLDREEGAAEIDCDKWDKRMVLDEYDSDDETVEYEVEVVPETQTIDLTEDAYENPPEVIVIEDEEEAQGSEGEEWKHAAEVLTRATRVKKGTKRKRTTVQTTMSGEKQIQGFCLCNFCGYCAPHFFSSSTGVFGGRGWPYKSPVFTGCPDCNNPAQLTNIK